ncbi:MAG: HD domain-containing protein [Cyanobacteriota bacterium]|nr:HD domain-containing protein [Cyanobacteriota bacterium]
MSKADSPLAHTQRYIDALGWAADLHRHQRRKGKPVPYISHLIGVSSLVWEDDGDEDQAIAGLLHDAIEDAHVSDGQIAARFGLRVAQIVLDCTDTTGAVVAGGLNEPWLLRKTRYIEHLQSASPDSLLVIAADKAHNARDMVLDARRDAGMWMKFNGGLEGSTWYLLRLQQTFSHRLPGSRSVELLGESVQEILSSEAYRTCVPDGIAPAVWAAGYAERCRPAVPSEAGAVA